MDAILTSVTIRLDADADLRAACLPIGEADSLACIYSEAAQAICEGVAGVTVERVLGGEWVGCDQDWAQEYGLWQAAHDCCWREDVCLHQHAWSLNAPAVERHRAGLRRWMVQRGIIDPAV
jgi:hypothetical protein